MVSNRLVWATIFSKFSYPCEVTDALADGMIVVDVDVFPDIGIIVMATPSITLEFVVGVIYDADVLTVVIIGVVSATDVDMLADENVNGLAVAMTPLESTLPAP